MVTTYAATTSARMVGPRSAPLPAATRCSVIGASSGATIIAVLRTKGGAAGQPIQSGANQTMLARIASEPSALVARSPLARSPLPSSAIPAVKAAAAATADVDGWVNGGSVRRIGSQPTATTLAIPIAGSANRSMPSRNTAQRGATR